MREKKMMFMGQRKSTQFSEKVFYVFYSLLVVVALHACAFNADKIKYLNSPNIEHLTKSPQRSS